MVFDEYRTRREHVWIDACGPSMRPLIHPGASLLVEFGAPVAGPGDIVLFAHGDLLVAHRVVAWRQTQGTAWLVVKGDAEPYADPPLRAVDVLGVVRAYRAGSGGAVLTTGCAGHGARASAYVSRWLGRGARVARRAARLLPKAVRPVAEQGISIATRYFAEAMLTPVRWTAAQPILPRSSHEGR